jgi:hypothetical protein
MNLLADVRQLNYICKNKNSFHEHPTQSNGSSGISQYTLYILMSFTICKILLICTYLSNFMECRVPTNRYLSYVSSSSDENIGMEEESETFSRHKLGRSTRGQKIKKKFNTRMKFFLSHEGLCPYDDERKGHSKVPLR